jgi:hypothetical protein
LGHDNHYIRHAGGGHIPIFIITGIVEASLVSYLYKSYASFRVLFGGPPEQAEAVRKRGVALHGTVWYGVCGAINPRNQVNGLFECVQYSVDYRYQIHSLYLL